MSTVAAALRDMALAGRLDEIAVFLNRELIPFCKEIRLRFNERHGRTTRVTDTTATMDAEDEFVVYAPTANATYTLLPAANSRRTLNIKNTSATYTVTVTAATGETIEGLASISIATSIGVMIVPEPGQLTWHVMSSYP